MRSPPVSTGCCGYENGFVDAYAVDDLAIVHVFGQQTAAVGR